MLPPGSNRPPLPPLGPRPPLTPLGPRPPLTAGSPLTPLGPRPPLAAGSPLQPLAPRPPIAPLDGAPVRHAGPRPPKMGPAYRGLPGIVRFVLWVGAAIVIGGVVGATGPTALRRLGAVAALQPGLLAWYTVRTLGFLAYLVVAGSVLYGLLLSTKILDAIAHRPVSFALHKDLAVVGLVLAILHSVVLLADQSFAFTPRAILVPFSSPYATTWVGIGQLTLYGLAVVTASFYVRRQIGQRAWRLLHYLTFLVFIGATGHGIMSGSDSGSGWAFWVYLVPGSTAIFLLVYRIVVSVSARLSGSDSETVPALSPLITRAPVHVLPVSAAPVQAAPFGPSATGSAARPTPPLEPPAAPPMAASPVRPNVRNHSAAPGGLRWPT